MKFSVHKFEKTNFLARIWMKYFHMGIFVILRVYLVKQYGCQTQAFFSVFQCFLDHRADFRLESIFQNSVKEEKHIKLKKKSKKIFNQFSRIGSEDFNSTNEKRNGRKTITSTQFRILHEKYTAWSPARFLRRIMKDFNGSSSSAVLSARYILTIRAT